MRELIGLLEKSYAPSRELDARIWAERNNRDVLVEHCPGWGSMGLVGRHRAPPHDKCVLGVFTPLFKTVGTPIPRYTEDMASALSLRRPTEGIDWQMGSASLLGTYWAEIITTNKVYKGKGAPNAATAVCIAALKAIADIDGITNHVTNEDGFLPCPFCGGVDIRSTEHSEPRSPTGLLYSMCCYNCGATFPNRYKRQLLVNNWNRRAGPDPERTSLVASLQIEASLTLAVNMLSKHESGDSRAVSDEFVALAAMSVGDRSPKVFAVINNALARSNNEHTPPRQRADQQERP